MMEAQLEQYEGEGLIMKADTIEELADKMGFTGADKDNFVATVARYNELYDKQNDEDFGKPASRLSAIRTAPFYGCWLGASLLCSMQGISITENCQAKDSNNEPIPACTLPAICPVASSRTTTPASWAAPLVAAP